METYSYSTTDIKTEMRALEEVIAALNQLDHRGRVRVFNYIYSKFEMDKATEAIQEYIRS